MLTTPTWQSWWELNRDRYLATSLGQSGAVTGGSELNGGLEGGAASNGEQAHGLATALLEKVLGQVDQKDRIAVLEAVARSGSKLPLEEFQATHLGASIRDAEQVVLSLGFERSPRAMEELFALIENTREGRALVGGRKEVPTSVRVQAAAAIGVFASDPGRGLLNQMVTDRLARLVVLEPDLPQEVQKACVVALGSSLPRDGSASSRRLMSLLEQRGRADDVLAQVPVAAAKLATTGKMRPEAVQECAQAQLHLLQNRHQPAAVRQGAAQGLGVLASVEAADSSQVIDGLSKALHQDPNSLVRNLATMSLAYAGARDGSDSPVFHDLVLPVLLQQLADARGEGRAWAALSLGVMGARAREVGGSGPPERVGRLLLEAFEDGHSGTTRGALALALGLLRYEPASDPLHQAWHDSGDPEFLRPCTLALGLLGARETQGDLHFMLEHSGADAWTIRDATLGLELMAPGAGIAALKQAMQDDAGRTPRSEAAVQALRSCPAGPALDALSSFLAESSLDPALIESLTRNLGRLLNPSGAEMRQRFTSDLNPAQLPTWLTGEDGLLHRL